MGLVDSKSTLRPYYWYATHGSGCSDCPREVELTLLKNHLAFSGKLPRWNKAF